MSEIDVIATNEEINEIEVIQVNDLVQEEEKKAKIIRDLLELPKNSSGGKNEVIVFSFICLHIFHSSFNSYQNWFGTNFYPLCERKNSYCLFIILPDLFFKGFIPKGIRGL